MPCSTLDTTTIRLSWRELGSDWSDNGPLWISDTIEVGMSRDAAINARVNADSFTITIEIRTTDITDAATWLKETGLV